MIDANGAAVFDSIIMVTALLRRKHKVRGWANRTKIGRYWWSGIEARGREEDHCRNTQYGE